MQRKSQAFTVEIIIDCNQALGDEKEVKQFEVNIKPS